MLEVAERCWFAPRTVLFERGELAHGVYLLRSGRVAMFSGPQFAARRQRVELADCGAILGLGEVLAEGRYGLTAESAGSVEAAYVSQARLLALLRINPEACTQLRRLLVGQIDVIHAAHRLLGGPGLRSAPKRTPQQVPGPA